MANHAYVVTAVIPGLTEFYFVVAKHPPDAEEVLSKRMGATVNETITAVTALRDDVAQTAGANLGRRGHYSQIAFAWQN